MCKIGSAVIAPNHYSKINKKIDQVKDNVTHTASKVVNNIPKINDSIKLAAKTAKNTVIHSVNISQNLKPEMGEKLTKTVSGVIGNTQDILDVTKKVVTIGESTSQAGALGRTARVVAPTVKTLTSLRLVKGIDKLVNNPIANKTFGVFAVAGGGFEIARGVKEIKKGNKEQGVYNIVNGGASVVCGAALFVGAVPVATAAGVVGLSAGVVKYGNDSVKKLGWLKSKDGKDQSAFERLGERANDAEKAVAKATGSKALGYAAKVGSGIAMVPAAIVTSVGGAVVQGGQVVGNAAGNAWNYLFNR